MDNRDINRYAAIDKACGYAFLYIGFAAINLFFAFYNRVYYNSVLGLGFSFISGGVLYIVYICINHLLVKRVIPHKRMFVFEILLLVTIICEILSMGLSSNGIGSFPSIDSLPPWCFFI